MTEKEIMQDFERNVRQREEKLRKDLIEGAGNGGNEVKGILKPLNPYRPCCQNCQHFCEPFCCRISGVQMFKERPRRTTRCGYFVRIKRQRNG